MIHNLSHDQILSLAYIGAHLGGIVHNVNTPLSAIMGRVELMQMRLENAAEASKEISPLLKKCRSDLEIIGQCCLKIDSVLKNSMRTTAGILSSRVAEIRLNELLGSILSFLNADMAYKHQVTKSFDIPGQVPMVTGDPIAYSLAFLEILYNARNAMLQSAEKRLHVALEDGGGALKITIRDSGCGITEPELGGLRDLLNRRRAGRISGRESGLQRVRRLLKPYGVMYGLESRPGETVFMLIIPVGEVRAKKKNRKKENS